MQQREETILVVDRHTLEVVVAIESCARTCALTIGLNGKDAWRSIEQGSGVVGSGVAGQRAFFWCPRKLIVVPLAQAPVEPYGIECDEDLFRVFSYGDAWLLVCETSLRLVDARATICRVELPDVVTGTEWQNEENLQVACGTKSFLARIRQWELVVNVL